MQATRQADTPAELALRSALHKRGLRFRLHRAIPGAGRAKPDIVFPKARVAVFVDGCFWHRCPEHGTMPKANSEWWAEKLAANEARDRRHDEALRSADWTVVRVWEHEDAESAAEKVRRVVMATAGAGWKSDG